MSARKGNFLYYNIADHVFSCLLFLFAILLSYFFPLGTKGGSPLVMAIAFWGTAVFSVVVICYTLAAIDNLLYLPLFLPIKLILAGLVVVFGIFTIGSLMSAAEKGKSSSERLAAAGKGVASGAASGGIYYLMQQCTKHHG